MNLRRLLAAVLACALLSSLRPIAPSQAAAPTDVPAQVQTLANGLRVVVLEDHAAPVAQVAVWYRFGAGYETPGKTGLAHGLEHMMFRGTPALSTAGLDDLGARLGAQYNASTNNEYTHYYFVVPSDRTDLMIHVEADRMANLKLEQKDWDVEKQAVLQEWDQDYSRPQTKFGVAVDEALYPNSGFGSTALGVRDDIVKSTAVDLRKYHSEYYVPNNATLVVTGDVKAADVFASAKEWFGPIAQKPLPPAPAFPKAASGATVEMTGDTQNEVLDLAYALPPETPQNEKTLTALRLAVTALQNPRGDFRKLLGGEDPEGGAGGPGGPGGGRGGGGRGGGVISVRPDRHASSAHARLNVTQNRTAADVRTSYDKAIAQTMQTGINPEFIDAARHASLAALAYTRDSITGLGDRIGSRYVNPGDLTPEQSEALIKSISVADVNAAFRTYFVKPNVVGDFKPASAERRRVALGDLTAPSGGGEDFTDRVPDGVIVQAPWVKAGLDKPMTITSHVKPVSYMLPNGMRLLVQEVHANPTVFINGTVRLSSTFDPAGKTGLSALTAGVVGAGSAKYDQAAIRKMNDDLAAQIRFGDNFSAHGLASDTNTLIDVLADDLQHPAFPEDRFTTLKRAERLGLSRRDSLPAYRSSRAFLEALYPAGDPALAEPSTASLEAITMDDVKAFYAKYYRPDLTTIAVVGDINAEEIHAKILAAFGGWTATGPKPDAQLPPVPPPAPVRKIVEVAQRDDEVQIGTTAIARTSPDYDTFRVMNSLLGNGNFDSRLMDEARAKRGLVYGISSRLAAGRDRGTLTIAFRAVPSKADAAVTVVKTQLRRLQTELVPEGELMRQKVKMTAAQAVAEQSTAAIAADLLNIGTSDLPLDYYTTLSKRFAPITPADIERVAKAYLHPDNLVEVRTGPKTATDN
jgi:zinc protease